jgi:hypothetical protein
MIARTTAPIGLPVTNSPPASVLSLGRYLCWWTISRRESYPCSSPCYHWVDTSAGGLLVTGSPIRAVVRAIIGSIPLLMDY